MIKVLSVLVIILCGTQVYGLSPDSIPFHQEKGWGVSIGFGLLSANAGNEYQGEIGSQGSIAGLYHLGKGHALGLGIGTQLPSLSSGMLHYPLFIQYQYFLNSKPNIKLGTKAGYSFASVNVDRNIYVAEGGWMVESFVGIKINRSQDWAWNFELGLLYQELYYQFGDLDITGNEEVQDWKLWRFVFRTTIDL